MRLSKYDTDYSLLQEATALLGAIDLRRWADPSMALFKQSVTDAREAAEVAKLFLIQVEANEALHQRVRAS